MLEIWRFSRSRLGLLFAKNDGRPELRMPAADTQHELRMAALLNTRKASGEITRQPWLRLSLEDFFQFLKVAHIVQEMALFGYKKRKI